MEGAGSGGHGYQTECMSYFCKCYKLWVKKGQPLRTALRHDDSADLPHVPTFPVPAALLAAVDEAAVAVDEVSEVLRGAERRTRHGQRLRTTADLQLQQACKAEWK